MSDEALKAGLARFRDIQEAPRRRARITELEEMLEEKEGEIEKINLAFSREKTILQNKNNRLENRIQKIMVTIGEFESIRIKVGKDKVSLREFEQRAKKQVKKEMQEEVVSRANVLAEIKIPFFVKAEIMKYPDYCMDDTKSLIEQKAVTLRNEYLGNKGMWSSEFRSRVNNHIHRRVGEQKNKSFWEEVHKKADAEIDQRLPDAWARFLNQYASKFIQNTIQNQLRSFSIPITLYCQKCQGSNQIILTPNELAILIRTGVFSFPCGHCTGWFKQKIAISLGELLWLIQKGDVIPERIPLVRAYLQS